MRSWYTVRFDPFFNLLKADKVRVVRKRRRVRNNFFLVLAGICGRLVWNFFELSSSLHSYSVWFFDSAHLTLHMV